MSNDCQSTSDVEVISNPPSVSGDMESSFGSNAPKILYSDIVKRPPQQLPTESDVDVVGDVDSPQLEYDDEDYLNEIIRSTKPSSVGGESDEDSEKNVVLPNNVQTMSRKELAEKEIVLEVNLTLLSFSIFIGISGMSGFLLGGIYSAVLTNNISPSAGVAQYPGSLPVIYIHLIYLFIPLSHSCSFFLSLSSFPFY